jgi:hypothetical protein
VILLAGSSGNDCVSSRRRSDSQISHSQSIKGDVEGLLGKNPLLKPRDLCQLLGLSYLKYHDYVSHIRSKWRSDCRNGLGLKCLSFHGVHGWVTVPSVVDRGRAVSAGWLRSRARNRMLVWKDELGRLEWFETGRCKVWVRKPANRGRALQLVCNGFSLSGLVSDMKVLDSILASLRLKGGTAVVDTGERLPYLVIDLFRISNGVKIKTGDDSHPTCFEIEFSYPDWAERNERLLQDLLHCMNSASALTGVRDPRSENLCYVA